MQVNNLISNIPTQNNTTTVVERNELRRSEQKSQSKEVSEQYVSDDSFKNSVNQLDAVIEAEVVDLNIDLEATERGSNLDILV